MNAGNRFRAWFAVVGMVLWLGAMPAAWAQDEKWTTYKNTYMSFDYPASWSKTELSEVPAGLTSMLPQFLSSLVTIQTPVVQLTTPDGQSALVYAGVGLVSWAIAGLGLIQPGVLADTTSGPGALAGATGRLVALANQSSTLVGVLTMNAPQQLFDSMNNGSFNRIAQSFCLVQDNTCFKK